jgi:hypothetical protein
MSEGQDRRVRYEPPDRHVLRQFAREACRRARNGRTERDVVNNLAGFLGAISSAAAKELNRQAEREGEEDGELDNRRESA